MPVTEDKTMVQIRRHNHLQNQAEIDQGSTMNVVTRLDERQNRFSIMLVGANPLYQKALKLILNDQAGSKGQASYYLHGCSTAEDFETDVGHLPEPQRQSVIVLLLDDGGEPALTIKNIEKLRTVSKTSKIIVISSSKNVDYINRCIEKGVHAYILSDISEDLLIDCVSLVAHGQVVFPSHIYRHNSDLVTQQPGPHCVTTDNTQMSGIDQKESVILGCLASGKSNKEISRLTDLSEPAIKLAVRKILCKIGAKNRVQAAVWAEKNGYSLDE
jgi:DNA-binding NarL/FixJ family response regulator